MYRGKLWTMRQFSGFATPEETNRRYHYLLAQGQTGLSVAFDLPTLMGYDADHPLSEGEVGKCGAAISSLEDMEILFRGIPLGDVTVSMTINSPAAVLWAMYLVVAEQQGVDWAQLSGTLQNDILKEYIAQKEYIFPPHPSMRLVTDTIEFGAQHTPRFNPISISGYHIREAGSTAVQELAFTLRDGMEYVDWALERGLKIDEFAPRLSFFFNAHSDFFEEIAKYRAARKIWAHAMRERYGAASERSMKLRFHAQTAGCSLTWQQPYNNVVRTALQAMSAVLGGAQSLHTNSLDEAYALPGEQAVTIALRTQQVLAYESGVTNTQRLHPPHRRHGRHGAGHRSRVPADRNRRRQLPLSVRGRGGRADHRGGQPIPVRRSAHRTAANRREQRAPSAGEIDGTSCTAEQ
jgi:methylmalonyl-CoA mutase N-terminal domain/subunit